MLKMGAHTGQPLPRCEPNSASRAHSSQSEANILERQPN